MMGPIDVVLGPWRAVRVIGRAAEDLNAVAERARRDPDPVEEARKRLDALFTELETLIAGIRKVDASAVALGAGGDDLLVATRSLNSTARAIETGGRELRRTGEVLDEHTQELITGGQDLTAVAKDLADSLRVLRAALPRAAGGARQRGTARGIGRDGGGDRRAASGRCQGSRASVGPPVPPKLT
jgi:hypothetical protein